MNRCPLALLLSLFLVFPLSAQVSGRTLLFDFEAEDALREWRAVNDGVMGGISKGGPKVEKGILIFEGETRLENNGGFSSVQSTRNKVDLTGARAISLRVRGSEERTFKLQLQTNARSSGFSVAYWQDFSLKGKDWQTVVLPLDRFKPTRFGFELEGPALDLAEIRSVGFMMYDKKAGPFRLECDLIEALDTADEAPSASRSVNTDEPTLVDLARESKGFETLLAAAEAAGLIERLSGPGPFTVFAPTDQAFAKLGQEQIAALLLPANRNKLRQILTTHVLPGRLSGEDLLAAGAIESLSGQPLEAVLTDGRLRIAGALVLQPNLEAQNGIVHVIDRVILPESAPNNQTIVDLARRAGQFGTLLKAVAAAGLAETLLGPGPFTVLAPTDEAFAALPAGTVEDLLRPERRAELRRILSFHVLSGAKTARDFAISGELNSLAGAPLRASFENGRLKIDRANILTNDLRASNGIVHVIDAVLLPPQEKKAGPIAGLIELAIEKAVPEFNAGNIEACIAIYELTITAIATFEVQGLSGEARANMVEALANASRVKDRSEAAWILRRALDRAWATL